MKLRFLILFLAMLLLFNCKKTFDNDKKFGPYFGQNPPGDTPELFMPGIISTGAHDMSLTISNDLKKIIVGRSAINWTSGIVIFEELSDGWSEAKLPVFAQSLGNNYPAFSPDNSKLYFNSKRSLPGKQENNARKIWFSDLNNGQWSGAKPVKSEIGAEAHMAYPSVAKNSNIYFNSTLEDGLGNSDVYCLKKTADGYGKPENLGSNINTGEWEFHPYISPDEDYIIFDAAREEGFGSNDLYISFKQSDGSWSKAVNMGETVNTKNADMRPYVSPDGKFLFFCSNRSIKPDKSKSGQLNYSQFSHMINGAGNGSQDIYWVDAGIIDRLKSENLK